MLADIGNNTLINTNLITHINIKKDAERWRVRLICTGKPGTAAEGRASIEVLGVFEIEAHAIDYFNKIKAELSAGRSLITLTL